MSIYIHNLLRFVLLILIQTLLLNQIPLSWNGFPYIPYIYPLFILLLPIATPVSYILILGFITGITMDMFMNTGGIHAFSCVLIAYSRNFVLRFFLQEKLKEYKNNTPGLHNMSWASFLLYSGLLIVLHIFIFSLIEVWSLSSLAYVLNKVLFSSLTSMVLVVIYLLLFSKSSKSLR